MVALPALAGLVVCASDAGVTTSWGERPCPKKGAVPGLTADDGVAIACVVVPEAHPAPLVAAPDLRAPAPAALPALAAALPLPPAAPVALLDGPRGPPSGSLAALRTIVLRV